MQPNLGIVDLDASRSGDQTVEDFCNQGRLLEVQMLGAHSPRCQTRRLLRTCEIARLAKPNTVGKNSKPFCEEYNISATHP
jgi:hypothetical protein